MFRSHTAVLALLVLLSGCGDPPAADPVPPAAPPAAVVPAAPPVVAGSAATPAKVLTPSPLALEKEVRDAGIAGGLVGLVPKRTYDLTSDDKDRIALRTGVLLAYTVLAGRDTPKDEFVSQIHSIREGMAALGTGQGLLAKLDKFEEGIRNDAASREDFLSELDAVAAEMVPEQGWGKDDRTGPLLQAGCWLAGTNLVARAIVQDGKAEAADTLLRRPYVTEYFLGYVRTEGDAKAGELASTLEATLVRLQEISAKPKLELEDARAVADTSDALLKLL